MSNFALGRSCGILLFLLSPCYLQGGQTTVLFQPGTITSGPFPSNLLTRPDAATKTGLRIAIPSGLETEACRSDQAQGICSNVDQLNQLDGFSVNSRVMVCFSDKVNTQTLRDGIKLIPVDSPDTVLSLNQFAYHANDSTKSYCAYAKPDNVLNQASRYLLVTTDAVLDQNGSHVGNASAFRSALSSNSEYAPLAAALQSLPANLPLSGNIVSASLFTTMSATSWLEDARSYVHNFTPGIFLPAGLPYQFKISDLSSFTWQVDTGSGTAATPVPLNVLSGASLPAGSNKVGSVEFGMFLSPNYLNTTGAAIGTITTSNTQPVTMPNFLGGLTFGYNPVSFHVFLPAGSTPPGGWPVVIYGHGLGDNQFGAPTYIASVLAANGYATLALEVTGHGGGPSSTVALIDTRGNRFTVAAPGRSAIPCAVPGAVAIRDCSRQSAVDLFALVKMLQLSGRLALGLNPQNIYYVGQSLGSVYGTLFHAVEPHVQAAVLSVGGGSNVDVARLTPGGRQLGVAYLAGVTGANGTGLLNVPPAPPQDYFHDLFNDNYVYRDEPSVKNIDEVPGALAIQSAFESAEWIGMLGDPLAYAPHLKNAPLSGVPVKSTFFQYSLGDLEEPNPANSALIRAAGAKNDSWIFRFDKATLGYGAKELLGITSPGSPLPILPHRILSNPTIFDYPNEKSIALAQQQATATFFNSKGTIIPNPNRYLTGNFAGAILFEQPDKLPESLSFIQLQK